MALSPHLRAIFDALMAAHPDGLSLDDAALSVMIANPSQKVESLLRGNLIGGERAANIGGVDGALPKASQVHLIVTRRPHNTLHVVVGIQTVLAQDDPGETPRGGFYSGRALLRAGGLLRPGSKTP